MNYSPTWKLETIPDAAFQSEIGRRRVAKRTTRVGGAQPGAGRPMRCRDCGHCPACARKAKRLGKAELS